MAKTSTAEARHLRILMLLRSAELGLTVAELAAGCEMSIRTITRDLELLRGRGAPIRSRRGQGGCTGLKPGYRQKLAALSRPEAQARLSGALSIGGPKMFAAVVAEDLPIVLQDLKPETGAYAGVAMDVVGFDPADWDGQPSDGERLGRIVEAIAECKVLSFMDGDQRARVKPLRMMWKAGRFFLVVADGEAMRVLPVNRLGGLVAETALFEPPPPVVALTAWRRGTEERRAELEEIEVTFRYSHNGMAQLSRGSEELRQARSRGVQEDGGWWRTRLMTTDLERLAVELALLGAGSVEEIQPTELAARVTALVENARRAEGR